MPILIVKYKHIHVAYGTYITLSEKPSFAYMNLNDHLPRYHTKPCHFIELLLEIIFPSQFNMLKVAITPIGKE